MQSPKKGEKMNNLWKSYQVEMAFNGRLCGSVPLSKDLVPIWLNSRMPSKKPDDSRPIEDIEAEVKESIQETEERTTLGFQSDDFGLWVRGGTIKAHLKDCANQIKYAVVVGVKNLRAKIANKIYIEEYRVYLTRDGNYIVKHDDSYEQPVHVWTPQGPRNALKVIQFVEHPILKFHLKFLNEKKGEVTEDILNTIFEYGGIHGYGGERGLGEGRYEFELTPENTR